MKTTKLFYLCISAVAIFTAVLLVKCSNKPSVQPTQTDQSAASANLKTNITSFVHPGILNTKQSLDIISQQANSGDAFRTSAYQIVLNYCNTHSPSNNYKATVNVAGGTTTPDETSFKGDALLAYALALRWAKTGTASYATTVIDILNGWASHFQNFNVSGGTETRQAHLEASWAAPTFAAAAEIIRSYKPLTGAAATWSSTDIAQFKSFLDNMNVNYISKVVDQDHMTNNWEVSAGYAKMAIGVFEDSQNLYNAGLAIVKKSITDVIAADGSMNGELCGNGGNPIHQDCVHFQYSLTGLSYAANIAGIQNDLSVYSYSSSRLLAGYNYQYKWYTNQLSNPPGCVTCTATGAIWPGICVANRHYNTTATNYIQSHYQQTGDPNNGNDDGLPGGDVCFLSWTSYTHQNVVLN